MLNVTECYSPVFLSLFDDLNDCRLRGENVPPDDILGLTALLLTMESIFKKIKQLSEDGHILSDEYDMIMLSAQIQLECILIDMRAAVLGINDVK